MSSVPLKRDLAVDIACSRVFGVKRRIERLLTPAPDSPNLPASRRWMRVRSLSILLLLALVSTAADADIAEQRAGALAASADSPAVSVKRFDRELHDLAVMVATPIPSDARWVLVSLAPAESTTAAEPSPVSGATYFSI